MPVITMPGLNSYAEEGGSAQKQTHITIPNPSHEAVDNLYADEGTVQEHFNAANAVQNSQFDRKQLTGDFLVAVNRANNGDEEVEEAVNTLLSLVNEE